MNEKIALHVFVISDATGRTAESVIKAVLVQFPDIEPQMRRLPNVRTKNEITEILDRAEGVHGTVIYSLVSGELRDFIKREGKRRKLILFDLLGPLLGQMRRLFNLIPVSTPGLLAHVQEESLRIAQAIEFTLRHDDGLGVDTLDEADLIILGVSRSSKTPTSIYLACNHLRKVANIPIVPDGELPQQIYRTRVPKVGFTIDPERLAEIRKVRIKNLPGYTDLRHILMEVERSREIFRRLPGIQILDVTYLSIEEIAGRIMESRI